MHLKATLYQWVNTNRVILVNATSLVSTTVTTSALGFVYWWLAARHFPPAAVGLASAAVSAMMLLAGVSSLGLGTLLISELPRQSEKGSALLTTALIVAGTAGGFLGFLFATLAPYLSADLRPLAASSGTVAFFALGVGLNGLTVVLDEAVIGLLRGGLQLWRNILFASMKLALLWLAASLITGRTGMTIYTTWVIGSLSSIILLALPTMLRGRNHLHLYRPEWSLLRQLPKAALRHHALNLTIQAPTLALPLLATILLSTTVNAYFYAAWMLARFVFVGPIALTVVLHAVGVAGPEMLARQFRSTLGTSLVISVLANGALLVGAGPFLRLFGQAYAQHAEWSLRILGLAVFPLIVKHHYIAIIRIYDQTTSATLVMAIGGLLELALAALGARIGGLTGLSIGWVSATGAQALYLIGRKLL